MIVCRSESLSPAGELVPPVVEDDSEVGFELANAGVVVGVCGAGGVETFEEVRFDKFEPETEPNSEARLFDPKPRTLPSIEIN